MTRSGYNGGIKVHAPSLREDLLANVTVERAHSSVSIITQSFSHIHDSFIIQQCSTGVSEGNKGGQDLA